LGKRFWVGEIKTRGGKDFLTPVEEGKFKKRKRAITSGGGRGGIRGLKQGLKFRDKLGMEADGHRRIKGKEHRTKKWKKEGEVERTLGEVKPKKF